MRTIAEKWKDEGRIEGETIGFDKGVHDEAQHLLLRTLPRLFGELPPSVIEIIHQLNLEQLRQALDIAFDMDHVTEFEATLRGWLTPSTQ